MNGDLRLIERIQRATELRAAPYTGAEHPPDMRMALRNLKERLANCPVVLADAAAEFVWAETDRERWDLLTDFPRWLPPYRSFWLECARPSVCRSEETGINDTGEMFSRWGIYLEAKRAGELPPSGLKALEWGINAVGYAEHHGTLFGPLGMWMFCLDSEGQQIARPSFGLMRLATQRPPASVPEGIRGLALPLLLTLRQLTAGAARLTPVDGRDRWCQVEGTFTEASPQ